jgi:hypothetical protein
VQKEDHLSLRPFSPQPKLVGTSRPVRLRALLDLLASLLVEPLVERVIARATRSAAEYEYSSPGLAGQTARLVSTAAINHEDLDLLGSGSRICFRRSNHAPHGVGDA